VDVLLVSGRTATSFQIDVAGAQILVGASVVDTQPADQITARLEAGKLNVYRKRGAEELLVAGSAASPVRISGPAGSVQTLFRAENGFYGRHYRGVIALHHVGNAISVVNEVPLEQYLYSVVPAEMPTSWHAEALRAQSIAARSYAVATRSSTGIYDLHSDTRSQMYGGIEEEEATSTAAVDGTAGLAALSAGVVIPAFFHSTSGGRTAAVEDVWNSAPRAYLKSKPDPYEVSPYSSWEQVFTPAQVANKLHGYLKGNLVRVDMTTNASGRAEEMTVVGAAGSKTIAPGTFQFRLGLRSTFFRVEKLAIGSTTRRVAPGAKVLLNGAAPKGGASWLVVRTPAGTWARVARLRVRAGGAWTKSVRVRTTSVYGLQRAKKVHVQMKIRVV